MKLVVGLGNPGIRYVQTRHNVGWMTIDGLVDRLSPGKPQERFHSQLWGPVMVEGEKLFLMKPLTFMNASGEAVREFARYHPLEPEDILVVFDEVALDTGRIRIRSKGSAGGHNGMKSIIACMGSGDIPRLRIGIGPRPEVIPMVDFVLGRFREEEQPSLYEALDESVKACLMWCHRPVEEVMNKFN
ncbi:aminoacyl-tRNA hydrolase [Dethiosulfovibrio salsuginis]|uniref:Peptidyl-tRNA hydrolase n=1 Tax=Dethiosulfovibrio salsuginis TaxID=561720 RepID=A0A1X7KTY9_9BACT|nr:aminoacyl-tRNA hydrolase [Dethiosulfovibrio salsuginis]SMG44701.1 peptidyl-tRNA hydrolase, PTH1 family [Dethiosulfovibrio salsuginis]